MCVGEILDQIEIHRQWLGISKQKEELFIDDIIPAGI